MKDLIFLATSLDNVRAFPSEIKQEAGYELHRIQMGEMPSDFKMMPTIGNGVVEIRLKDSAGIYRVIYTAKFAEMVYVLHAFEKKTQKTAKSDINLAKSRLKQLIAELNKPNS